MPSWRHFNGLNAGNKNTTSGFAVRDLSILLVSTLYTFILVLQVLHIDDDVCLVSRWPFEKCRPFSHHDPSLYTDINPER